MPERDLLSALGHVLRSVEGVRNLRALYVLLATFSVAGLLTAMAEASFGRDAAVWGALQAAGALFVAFYGGNTAGILVMDDARGGPVRDVSQAFRTALATAHRLLLALALVLAGCAVVAALLLGLLWLSRVAVTGAWLGALLFGIALPVGVVLVGGAALALVGVIVPLAAPAVWAGADVATLLHTLARTVRERLLVTLLLMAVVSLLAAGVGALSSMVLMVGGRVVSELGVRIVGIDVPARQLMAGLFGYGLRSFAAAGAPAAASPHAGAALIGGGIVFSIALLLPSLVYLRGACAIYLAMANAERRWAPLNPAERR